MHDEQHAKSDNEKQYEEEVIGLSRGAGDIDHIQDAPKVEAKDKDGSEKNQ